MVESYSEIEELLSNGEMKGRRWVFDRALSGEHAGTKPTDPATEPEPRSCGLGR